MLQFELYLINKVPESVEKFIHQNLFQRNPNHNDKDSTTQEMDYKLKEYNKLLNNLKYYPHHPYKSGRKLQVWHPH